MVRTHLRALRHSLREEARDRKRAADNERSLERLLTDPPSRRIELGSGPYPTPGFVHIDIDPDAPDLDVIALADEIPLPAGWAEELRAVHVVEHIPPDRLGPTFDAWHRLLRPGGTVDIHVPNGAALARAVLKSETEVDADTVWRANAAIFGYILHPDDASGPHALVRSPEHRVLLTFPLLAALLKEAGFQEIARPLDHACRHLVPWSAYIPDFCLRVTARTGAERELA